MVGDLQERVRHDAVEPEDAASRPHLGRHRPNELEIQVRAGQRDRPLGHIANNRKLRLTSERECDLREAASIRRLDRLDCRVVVVGEDRRLDGEELREANSADAEALVEDLLAVLSECRQMITDTRRRSPNEIRLVDWLAGGGAFAS